MNATDQKVIFEIIKVRIQHLNLMITNEEFNDREVCRQLECYKKAVLNGFMLNPVEENLHLFMKEEMSQLKNNFY